MPFKYPSPAERLARHSVLAPGPIAGSFCWIWLGSRNNVGRPRIAVRIRGRSKWVTVARFIVQFVHGETWGRNLSRRKSGAHSCNNPECANPDHVQRQSISKNVADSNRERARLRARAVNVPGALYTG